MKPFSIIAVNSDKRAYTLACWKLLGDTEWHRTDEFIALAEKIAPELASQKYETTRASGTRGSKVDLDKAIRGGRRAIALSWLADRKVSGIIEKRVHGVETQYRLPPAMLPLFPAEWLNVSDAKRAEIAAAAAKLPKSGQNSVRRKAEAAAAAPVAPVAPQSDADVDWKTVLSQPDDVVAAVIRARKLFGVTSRSRGITFVPQGDQLFRLRASSILTVE